MPTLCEIQIKLLLFAKTVGIPGDSEYINCPGITIYPGAPFAFRIHNTNRSESQTC